MRAQLQTLLFVAGVGRSGTSLMELALGQHPEVQPLGEVMHLWERGIRYNELCGCATPFLECPFWTQVGAQAFGGWEQVDIDRVARLHAQVARLRQLPQLARRELPAPVRSALTEYMGYYDAAHEAAASVSGCPVVIDSSKQVTLALAGGALGDRRLRVLHAVRDSRAVARAWTKEVSRPEANNGPLAVMHTYPPRTLAALWATHNAAVAVLPRMGVPLKRVRYEDFADSPRAVVDDVLRFAGLDPEGLSHDVMGEDWLDPRPQHSVSGNPMRLRPGVIRIKRDDSWVGALGASDLAVTTALTAPLLARYGYPLQPRPLAGRP